MLQRVLFGLLILAATVGKVSANQIAVPPLEATALTERAPATAAPTASADSPTAGASVAVYSKRQLKRLKRVERRIIRFVNKRWAAAKQKAEQSEGKGILIVGGAMLFVGIIILILAAMAADFLMTLLLLAISAALVIAGVIMLIVGLAQVANA